jgi:hypothetical protein
MAHAKDSPQESSEQKAPGFRHRPLPEFIMAIWTLSIDGNNRNARQIGLEGLSDQMQVNLD